MLPKSLCFVDLETTGTQAHWDKIIEIGIVKVENGKITKTYNQLLNPNTYLDPFIEKLTGITTKDLENAPTFETIKEEILEILEGSTFVAHNVRFDYGFLRNEFKRAGISFRSKHFCTIKLARQLYPKLNHYNLDSIIAHLNIPCKKRHRALDDAKAICDFYGLAQNQFKKNIFEKAVITALKRPALPQGISEQDLESLPESPGVYIFYGENNAPLYIGKSLNIYDRVLSHFSNDYQSTTDMQLQQSAKSVEAIPTAGELGALLLESTLIKKHQPLLNRQLRHARKLVYLFKAITPDGYNSVEIKSLPNVTIEEIENVIGVYRSIKQAKDHLYKVAEEHTLCPKVLNLEKTKGACFKSRLNKCKGACTGDEKTIMYNLRFDNAFYKFKIKPWNFEKPIIIKEVGESEEHFIIDKWCYLGSIKNEADYSNISFDYNFDLDTYKILKKFITNPKNSKKFQWYPYPLKSSLNQA